MITKTNTNSLLRREISFTQLATLVSFLYSCFIFSTLTPSISRIAPVYVILLYYLLVPGYCVSLLFGEDYDALQRLLFSILISISLVLSLEALNHISVGFDIPLAVSLPVISIGIGIYEFLFHRS